MLKKIVTACIASLALSGGACAQGAVAGSPGGCDEIGAASNAPSLGRAVIVANAACIAVRGVLPDQARAPLSREELISILLITTLQTPPSPRRS